LSLALRVEHRTRVNKNKFLKRIFGPKDVEIMGAWRKMHVEEFIRLAKHKCNKVKQNDMSRTYSTHAYRFFMGKTEGKTLIGKLRRK
jgi:hypothetical protein